MLSIENLHVRYGNIDVLHGVSFHVNEGEIVTLIGANGAGKTTTLFSICRVQPPDGPTVVSGNIQFEGESLLAVETHEVVAKKKISLVPEGRHIFGNLTVLENLELATYARKNDSGIKADYERVFFSVSPAARTRQAA